MGNLDFQVSFKQLVNGLRIAILNLKGSIDGSTVKIFEAKAMDLYNDGIKYLILNFEEIGYMNSTGLGILVKILDKYQDTDGDVKLLKVPRKIEDLFDMLGISSIVTSYSTLKEALYSLPSPVVETEPDENFALKSSELPSELDMNLDTNLGWDNDSPEALFDSGVDLKWTDNPSSDQNDSNGNNGNSIDYTETLNSNAFGIDLSNFNNSNTEAPQQNYDIFNIDVNEINKQNELDVLNDYLFSGQPQEDNAISNTEANNSPIAQNADNLLFSNMPENTSSQPEQSDGLDDLLFGNEPTQPEQSDGLDDLLFGNEPAQQEQAPELTNLAFGNEPVPTEQPADLTDLSFGSEPVPTEQPADLTDLSFGNEPVPTEQPADLTDLAFGSEPVPTEQPADLTDLSFGSEPVPTEQPADLTDLAFGNEPVPTEQPADLTDLSFGNEPVQTEQPAELTDLAFGSEPVQQEQAPELTDLAFGSEPVPTEQPADLTDLSFGSEPVPTEQPADLTDLSFGSEPVPTEQPADLTDLSFGNEPVPTEQAPELTDLAFGNEPVPTEQAPELTDLAFGSEPVQTEQAPELTDLAFGSEPVQTEQAPELTDLAFGSEPVQQEQAPEVESQEAINESDASLEESSELKIDTITEPTETEEETPESTQENIDNVATENKEETPESTQENIDNVVTETEEENESEKVFQDAFELTEDKTVPTPVNQPIVANNEANIVEKSQDINALLLENKQEQKDNDIPDEVLDAFRDSEEKVDKVHTALSKTHKAIDVRYYHKMHVQKVYSLDVDVNQNKDVMIAPCIPNCMVCPPYAFVKAQQEKQTVHFKIMPIETGNIQGTIDVFENNQKTMSTELKSKITCAFMSFFFFLCAFVTFAMYIVSSNIYIQRAMDYILDEITCNCPQYITMIQKIIDFSANYCALDVASATLLLCSVIFLILSIIVKVISMIQEKLSFK